MHRHDSLARKPIVHHGENALLHLASVKGTSNNSEWILYVKADKHFTVETILLPLVIGNVAAVDNLHGENWGNKQQTFPSKILTVKSGSKFSISSAVVGLKNMFVTKWCCQAISEIKRTYQKVVKHDNKNNTQWTFFLDLGLAPLYPSNT